MCVCVRERERVEISQFFIFKIQHSIFLNIRHFLSQSDDEQRSLTISNESAVVVVFLSSDFCDASHIVSHTHKNHVLLMLLINIFSQITFISQIRIALTRFLPQTQAAREKEFF